MKVISLSESTFLNDGQQIVNEPLCITMGYFDGLHRGHQALFAKTQKIANEMQGKSAVVTFDFSQVAHMKKRDKHLLTEQETQQQLAQKGIDYYIVIHFGDKLKATAPAIYLERLTTLFLIKAIIVGEDFHFGKDRMGDVKMLQQYTTVFDYLFIPVPLVALTQKKVSSSQIETFIKAGEVEQANELLAYPYQITGKVIHGAKKGRLLGFPTANLTIPQNKIALPNGVYVVHVIVNEKCYGGMTNIGLAPTIKDSSERIIETNIFDFSANIYDQEIQVLFYHRIRDEQKFSSIDALKEQLSMDIQTSKAYLSRNIRRIDDKK